MYDPETVPPVQNDEQGDDGSADAEQEDSDAPADPSAPDNTDYTYDGGAYARRMCRDHSVEYFCNLVGANEQDGGQ